MQVGQLLSIVVKPRPTLHDLSMLQYSDLVDSDAYSDSLAADESSSTTSAPLVASTPSKHVRRAPLIGAFQAEIDNDESYSSLPASSSIFDFLEAKVLTLSACSTPVLVSASPVVRRAGSILVPHHDLLRLVGKTTTSSEDGISGLIAIPSEDENEYGGEGYEENLISVDEYDAQLSIISAMLDAEDDRSGSLSPPPSPDMLYTPTEAQIAFPRVVSPEGNGLEGQVEEDGSGWTEEGEEGKEWCDIVDLDLYLC